MTVAKGGLPPKPASRPGRVSLWRYMRLFRRDILSAQPERLYRAWMAEFRTPFFRSFLINQPDLIEEILKTRPMDFSEVRPGGRGAASASGAIGFPDQWRDLGAAAAHHRPGLRGWAPARGLAGDAGRGAGGGGPHVPRRAGYRARDEPRGRRCHFQDALFHPDRGRDRNRGLSPVPRLSAQSADPERGGLPAIAPLGCRAGTGSGRCGRPARSGPSSAI